MKTHQRKWLPFSAIAIGLFSAVLDGSMIGIALPQISKDFSLDISKAAWVSLVSTITVVAILLPAGNMSDRIGRKRLFIFTFFKNHSFNWCCYENEYGVGYGYDDIWR